MKTFIIRRFATAILVLFGVSILVFMMIHLVPGDPVLIMLQQSTAGPEAVAQVRRDLGLDQPLPLQYVYWLIGNNFVKVDTDGDGVPDAYGTHLGILRGDFGRSLFKKAQVADIITDKFPHTLKLTLAVMLISIPLGIFAGVVAAVKRETFLDYATTVGALVGVSIPSFWLGLILMFVFGVQLAWVRPFIGDKGLVTLILPAITLAAPFVAVIARLTRSSMLNVLSEDYIRTARAKGVRERYVLYGHALRNAIIPVVTMIGLQFGYLLGGAVIVETVFVYPGLGNEVVTAILNRDFPMVQGIVLFSATLFVFINLATDVVYTIVDPRIQYG
ncbi:MAG TPA: ABC transporter permease [Phototrophicaceae bacterium]|nr:ABC transporter permease [Phototrophicaceae bacterium]